MTSEEQKAIATALMFVDSIYQWVDKVEAEGGTTSIGGVASAHAFINSLKKNKARILDAIVAPLKMVADEVKS